MVVVHAAMHVHRSETADTKSTSPENVYSELFILHDSGAFNFAGFRCVLYRQEIIGFDCISIPP